MNPEEYSQLMRLGETHWWFVGTRDLLFSSVSRRFSSDKPILDVGCGSGLMMKRFSGAGRVVGIDKDQSLRFFFLRVKLQRPITKFSAANYMNTLHYRSLSTI